MNQNKLDNIVSVLNSEMLPTIRSDFKVLEELKVIACGRIHDAAHIKLQIKSIGSTIPYEHSILFDITQADKIFFDELDHKLQQAIHCYSSVSLQVIPTKEKHITETKYPEQTKRFREILDEMYQVHLDKNRDYSPANILATGIVGLGTRIWDKTARICSLLGWDLQTGEYSSERKSTNDESIEDNLKDLGVYSIIARIFREGKWGK